MAKEREIEFKQLLTSEQYHQILEDYFSQAQPVKQINYYIDTNNLDILKQKMALRIREKNNTYEMTLKVPAEVGLYEYNEFVTIHPKEEMKISSDLLPAEIKKQLDEHDVDYNHLTVIGSLHTTRYEKNLDDNHLLVLDESNYFDVTDYELEMEVQDFDKGKDKFNVLLNEYDIISEKPKNKVQRFIEHRASLLEHRKHDI